MELETVDWAALEHAYGNASDVPEMLRELRSEDPDARKRARGGLHASLDHQGVQRGEATLRAIPFLVELLRDPATPERGALARLLAELAVGDTCWFLHNGVHRDHQMQADETARPQHSSQITAKNFATRGFPRLHENRLQLEVGSGLRWIYDAVADGVPAYVAALVGADENLRESIPFLCAFLTTDEAAAAAAPALTALLDDPSERVRASAAIGLSHATKFVPALWDQAFEVLSARWDRELGALERRCLALALVRNERPERTEAVRAYLRDTLAAGVPKVLPDRTFPWFRIDSPPFLFCTTWLGTSADDRPTLRTPALAALAAADHDHDAADLGVWIVKIWGDDREALRALAGATAAWFFSDVGAELDVLGLPRQRAELLAWLDKS